ncbi:sugar kinase [Miniphocaeibacter halophilus]|uniref:Sugar kinase n=1 Tax=Miniphocaeibacter halophilus TaxID=2931922 RepID=A0AC61MYG1_9FIRM|nr:sugar kinase [Miniphocaeibacter halophilus]QQK08374.1 sugar kinase [Miniphocaeibacter halophilus]
MNILAYGEVMMRLTAPFYRKLSQIENLEMSFTGTGVNLLSSLALNGYNTEILTTLPNNNVGKTAASAIRKLGISDKKISFSGNHIGVYFLELGYGKRPSEVTYLNRENSSFGESKLSEEDIIRALEGVNVVHICGIALSVSEITRKNAVLIAQLASSRGIKICFDFNYRPTLNSEKNKSKLIESYTKVLKCSDLVFGSIRDLRDLMGISGKDESEIIKKFKSQFNIEYFAGTKRHEIDGKKYIDGFIYNQEKYFISSKKEIEVLDRIGTGDAFAAGIITGILDKWDMDYTVEFAITCSELAHTTYGDSPVLDKDFVKNYMINKNDLIR